jgi:hypothetical protein
MFSNDVRYNVVMIDDDTPARCHSFNYTFLLYLSFLKLVLDILISVVLALLMTFLSAKTIYSTFPPLSKHSKMSDVQLYLFEADKDRQEATRLAGETAKSAPHIFPLYLNNLLRTFKNSRRSS